MIPLEFKNVSIGFKNLQLINEFSVEVTKPKIIALVGKNGCGKSTLFNTLLKIQVPLDGKILLNKNEIAIAEITKWNMNFGVFFPKRITPPISVAETLMIGYKSSTFSESDKRVLNKFQIDQLLQKSLNKLSSGELQKVLVAKAFLGNSSYVLLDEPFSHLDWEIRNDILLLLPSLSKELNKTILIISHDILNLLNCADDLWFISDKHLYHDSVEQALIRFNVIQKLIGSNYSFNYNERTIEFKHKNFNNKVEEEINFIIELWNRKHPSNRIMFKPKTKEELLNLFKTKSE